MRWKNHDLWVRPMNFFRADNLGEKIAFSGTHGTGKTTAAYQLAASKKCATVGKEVYVLTDLARECPFPINKDIVQETQWWIFSNQMSKELTLQSKTDRIVVCDRSILDAIAYAEVRGLEQTARRMFEFAKEYITTYSEIYFRCALKNDYWLNDGIRESTDAAFREAVEDALLGIIIRLHDSGSLKEVVIMR